MTDKDRCTLVTSLLPMSYRGSPDAFARSLHVRLRSLGIQDEDDDQNGINEQHIGDFISASLSPEEEIEDPLKVENIQRVSCDIVPSASISVHNGNDDESPLPSPRAVFGSPIGNFLESCSSYETASDQSADENDELWNEPSYSVQPEEITLTVSPSTSRISDNSNLEQNGNSTVVEPEEQSNKKTSLSPFQSDRCFEEDSPPKIRRCSSLKSGKTPPGTPGSKKIVRFADALGLDLADVKTFVDEIPKVPTSAYHDLRNLDDEADDLFSNKPVKRNQPEKILIALFQQPGGQPDFLDILRKNFVSLENALVDDPITFAIRGTVKVRNIDFHKSVFVRYSTDSWKNFVDVQATYVENSCDGFSDRFEFLIYANMLGAGESIEFAVVFQARGEQFWDNNNGANYRFQCISTCIPNLPPLTHVLPSSWDDSDWGASFY